MPIPVEQLIIKILADTKEYTKSLTKIKRENESFKSKMKATGKAVGASFLAAGTAITAFGIGAFNSFKKFETGVTNVAKTTNLAGKDLDKFKSNITAMSEEIPVSTDRLLEIATAAGQLGIQGVDELTKFTETIAKLGATTNIEGEEAALTLARLLNITGENVDTVDQLGASLVDLGNNFATTEAEILEISKDVAKATVQFGLGSDEILGMSAAMASLGINAEAGGTVVGKAFMSIDKAIRKQTGPAFEKLIELTGLTGDQLKKTFETDASKVFELFIGGLGVAGKAGKDVTAELSAMGLSGIRVNKILPTLASRSDLLAAALKRAGIAAKENTALNEEAARAFDTAASKYQLALNKINNTLIKLGAEIAPEMTEAITEISEVISANAGTLKGILGTLKLVINGFLTVTRSMQDFGRDVRSLFDSNLRKARGSTNLQNEFLKKKLKERGISEKEFYEYQKKIQKEAADERLKKQKESNAETTITAVEDKQEKINIENATAEELQAITKSNNDRLIQLNREKIILLKLEDENASDELISLKRDEISILEKIDDLHKKRLKLKNKEKLTADQKEELAQTGRLIEIYNERYLNILESQETGNDSIADAMADTYEDTLEEQEKFGDELVDDLKDIREEMQEQIDDEGPIEIEYKYTQTGETPAEEAEDVKTGETSYTCADKGLDYNSTTKECCPSGYYFSGSVCIKTKYSRAASVFGQLTGGEVSSSRLREIEIAQLEAELLAAESLGYEDSDKYEDYVKAKKEELKIIEKISRAYEGISKLGSQGVLTELDQIQLQDYKNKLAIYNKQLTGVQAAQPGLASAGDISDYQTGISDYLSSAGYGGYSGVLTGSCSTSSRRERTVIVNGKGQTYGPCPPGFVESGRKINNQGTTNEQHITKCRQQCCPGYQAVSDTQCSQVGGYKEGGIVSDPIHAQAGLLVPNRPGHKRDRVPIMAEPGEGILSKSTTALLLDTLDMFSDIQHGSGLQTTRISNTNSKTGQDAQPMSFEFFMNDNLAEFITIKQREGQNLGTMILP